MRLLKIVPILIFIFCCSSYGQKKNYITKGKEIPWIVERLKTAELRGETPALAAVEVRKTIKDQNFSNKKTEMLNLITVAYPALQFGTVMKAKLTLFDPVAAKEILSKNDNIGLQALVETALAFYLNYTISEVNKILENDKKFFYENEIDYNLRVFQTDCSLKAACAAMSSLLTDYRDSFQELLFADFSYDLYVAIRDNKISGHSGVFKINADPGILKTFQKSLLRIYSKVGLAHSIGFSSWAFLFVPSVISALILDYIPGYELSRLGVAAGFFGFLGGSLINGISSLIFHIEGGSLAPRHSRISSNKNLYFTGLPNKEPVLRNISKKTAWKDLSMEDIMEVRQRISKYIPSSETEGRPNTQSTSYSFTHDYIDQSFVDYYSRLLNELMVIKEVEIKLKQMSRKFLSNGNRVSGFLTKEGVTEVRFNNFIEPFSRGDLVILTKLANDNSQSVLLAQLRDALFPPSILKFFQSKSVVLAINDSVQSSYEELRLIDLFPSTMTSRKKRLAMMTFSKNWETFWSESSVILWPSIFNIIDMLVETSVQMPSARQKKEILDKKTDCGEWFTWNSMFSNLIEPGH